MDRMKGRSGMLMTRGFMDMRTSPPSIVCRIRTYRHPETATRVTLLPVPNTACTAYLAKITPETLSKEYDKILCEDGRLPYDANSSRASRQLMLKRLFPFFAITPVTSDPSKYDGIIQRDPFESRMAHQSVMSGMDPPVDPRARRAIERIESYPAGTNVVCPWTVYHMVYLDYRLAKLGYVVEKDVEDVAIGAQQIFLLMAVMAIFSFWSVFVLLRLVFGF